MIRYLVAFLALLPAPLAAQSTINGRAVTLQGRTLAAILPVVPATVDAPGLAAMSAAGPIMIDQPISLSANVTLAGPVTIQGAGRITTASGATLTFAQQPTLPPRQVFFGDGAVAGLSTSDLTWFAGSILNTTIDAQAALQRGIDAAVTSGVVEMPAGYWTVSGSTPLTISRGQRLHGQGKFKSQLLYTSATSNVLAIAGTTLGASIEAVTIGQPSDAVVPTGGTAIRVGAPYATLTDVIVRSSWIAIEVTDHVTTTRIVRPDLFDSQQIGLYLHDTSDVYVDFPSVIAPYDRLTFSSLSGTLAIGDVLVGQSSGATATINRLVSDTSVKALVDSVNFTTGEAVKDTTSGATFTLSAQLTPHVLGAMRVKDQVEALIVTGGELFGGAYALTTDADNNAPFHRPAYNKFVNVFMDSTDNGVLLNNIAEWDFTGCWFSNRPNYGLVIDTVDGVRFAGGGAINSAKGGVYATANAKNLVFTGFAARGNSTAQSGAYSGLTFAGTVGFIVTGGTMAGSIGFGTQDYAVKIAAAADRYIVTNNLTGPGGVNDGGSGTNKTVANNY